MVKTISTASQDISIQSKCVVNQKKKIKRTKSSVQNYSDYITTYRIILSVNIETNPGPGLSKQKCHVCDKTVRCNQKRLVCEHCLEMCHVKCFNHQLNQNASNKAYEWTCSNCIHTALPFYNRRNLDFDSTVTDETTILRANNCHIETLKNYQKYTLIAHINCQSILSTFVEFAVMLKSYEFDIISLSKTWLTNNQHQLDYVNTTSYKSIFKHRNDKREIRVHDDKRLAETLILSKINYCNVVYGQLSTYLINKLHRVQNTTAGYVYGRYAKTLDVINLNWLPIEENIEMNTVELVLWPTYLKLALIERKSNLRSSDLGPIIKQGDDYTFQQQTTV